MINDILKVLSSHFLTIGNGCIDHIRDLLNVLPNEYFKYCPFLCKLIDCEAQEGAELTIRLQLLP